TNYYRNRVLKVAKEFRRKVHFAISNKDDFYNEIKEYGLEAQYDKRLDTPMVAAQGVYGEKYRMDEEFSVENLKLFAENLLAGKLINYMKSEPIPARNDGPVKILVANNFKDVVDGKDSLIEIYAPWCGHCKALEPTFQKLGEKMKDEDIVIAKIDGTANDLPPGFSSQGFPTIYFKPKNGPPMMYQHGRELENFVNFLAHVSTDELKGWTREGKKRKKSKKEL
uniref:protein disulfide-isomerase n=1 Tax=Romanomermis culicivorax TaxID=13658 RepID=A0A915ISU3_ROMCU